MKDIKQLKLSTGKTYELCLTVKNAAKVERELGCSILTVLNSVGVKEGKMVLPTMDQLAYLLKAEILNEDISKEDALEIMDQYIKDGQDLGSLFLLITEGLGFLKVAPTALKK